MEKPYIIEKQVKHVKKYNPNFGDDHVCKCGHPYYRHFDTYEDMLCVGCKYCGCYEFEINTPKENDKDDLAYRLRKRAEIRRNIKTRKSVQEGKPDRLADLLDEAAARIESLEGQIEQDSLYNQR